MHSGKTYINPKKLKNKIQKMIYIISAFLSIAFVVVNSEHSKYFDNLFHVVYTKESGGDEQFGYDQNRVCKVKSINPREHYVHLQNVFDQFDRSALTRLSLPLNGVDELKACFNYNGNSYLLYRSPTTADSDITIVRGASEPKTFVFGTIRMTKIYFDHYYTNLYVLGEDGLYQMLLSTLDFYWHRNPTTATIIKVINISPLVMNNITDVLVFKRVLYLLTSNGALMKQELRGGGGARQLNAKLLESSYPDTKFDFIPFDNQSAAGGRRIYFATMYRGGAAVEEKTDLGHLLLYILNIFFLLFFLFILRIIYGNGGVGGKKQRIQPPQSIIMASSPLLKKYLRSSSSNTKEVVEVDESNKIFN